MDTTTLWLPQPVQSMFDISKRLAGFRRQRNGLYLPPGVMPFGTLGFDRCACCDGSTPATCANCEDGTTPGILYLETALFANSSCSDCAVYNGTFALVQDETDACQWSLIIPDATCTDSHGHTINKFVVVLTYAAGNYTLQGQLQSSDQSIYALNYTLGASKANCSSITASGKFYRTTTTNVCGGTYLDYGPMTWALSS